MADWKWIFPAAPATRNKTRLCSAAKPSVLFLVAVAGMERNVLRACDLPNENRCRLKEALYTRGTSVVP